MFKHRKIITIIASVLAIVMILSVVIGSISMSVFAASSSEIKSELNSLQAQSDEIQEKKDALQAEIAENESKTLDLVEQRSEIDRQIKLTMDEIENQNAQIQQYNLLIAAKQNELDEAKAEEAKLLEQYEERIRAMEESGTISYWSILFKSSSFTDLLDRLDMISEIAQADQEMMDKLAAVSEEISEARQTLEEEKAALETAKEELAAAEETLEQQREESDALINELLANNQELESEAEKYEAMEESLVSEIATKEAEYNSAVKAEEEAARAQNTPPSTSSGETASSDTTNGSSSDTTVSGGTSSGFLWPVGGSSYVSCAYGNRVHPITGNYSFHTGVDLAAASGTPIYATKSGTVTTATYSYVYGNYVVINHGDGYSSLYGHMTHYTVSAGQYVTQGQVIGYVGSTGWSTGAHLHFTIYYNGSTVNPMSFF